MLINFSVENWMSFKEKAFFSMVASRERQHGERLSQIKKYKMRVLPTAVIYGGNASGKTNFFKALSFARRFIVVGSRPGSMILTEPYKLDSKFASQPSKFHFEILVKEETGEENIYEFSFSVTRKIVLEEKLVLISSSSEKILYHRADGQPNFHSDFEKDSFLQFAFQGTRDNQLFLTNSISQKVKTFSAVFEWFNSQLTLIGPDARFGNVELFFEENSPLYGEMNEILPKLDTGIEKLGGEEVSFEKINIPEKYKDDLREEIKDGDTVSVAAGIKGERFVISKRDDGELICKKLITYHKNASGDNIKFELKEESDGTERIIDLLPAFLSISEEASDIVCIVDELDRSLHTLLTRSLLESYLDTRNLNSRSQLLFTTHDALLMDQDIFRRDEMWVTERTASGSNLLSFNDYKDVRYDKDIRKSYLQGRLGGVPRLCLNGKVIKSCCDNGRCK